jgi:copper chaperone
LTLALWTPGTFSKAFSTRATQEAQVMSPMPMSRERFGLVVIFVFWLDIQDKAHKMYKVFIQAFQQGKTMNQTFTVLGMTCGHCEKAVSRAITAVDPDAEIKIDRTANRVDVVTDKDRSVVAKAIVEEGYATT